MSNLDKIAFILKRIHDFIAANVGMNDKALHFVVIGIAGIILFLITFSLFKFFDKKNNAFAMTSVYTIVVVIIFVVVTGLIQGITPTSLVIIFLIGVDIFTISYHIFKYMDIRDKTSGITNFFTTTMVVIFAVAIEICQGLTKTGSMEIADVLFGIAGYLCMYETLHVIVVVTKAIFWRNQKSETKKDHRL